MKTLKDFTPEIKAKIPEYLKNYTEGIYDGGRHKSFDIKKAEALVNWNYETAGYKKSVVIVAENPKEMQVYFNAIKENKDYLLPLYLIYALKNNIELPKVDVSQLDSQLRSQLDSQLRSQLYSQLDSQLRSQLDSQLDSQLRSQLDAVNPSGLFTCDIYSNVYAAWFKFIKDEFKLESKIGAMLDQWSELYKESNVYTAVFSELVCVVCKYPTSIHVDVENRLHSTTGQAVDWAHSTDLTKWDCHYIHGVLMEPATFEKLCSKTLTFEDWAREDNEEVKSAMLSFMEERFGSEYLFRFISTHLKEVNTYTDKKDSKYLEGTTKGMNIGVYTLFKGSVNGIQMAFVRCYCPSTDRLFFLSVGSTNTNAKDAIASLYRIPSKLVNHIKSISRQGERYFTVFTDEGNAILDNLNKQEIADLKSISGKDYFTLMAYEF